MKTTTTDIANFLQAAFRELLVLHAGGETAMLQHRGIALSRPEEIEMFDGLYVYMADGTRFRINVTPLPTVVELVETAN